MTVERTFSTTEIKRAVSQYAKDIVGFNPEQWVVNQANVALVNSNGDVALFERQWRQPNTVCGHYFFFSRGKEARNVAQEMLKEIFTGPYGVEVVIGLTPTDHKGALWMNKQLGFKTIDTLDTGTDPCVLVMLTKKEWETMNG